MFMGKFKVESRVEGARKEESVIWSDSKNR